MHRLCLALLAFGGVAHAASLTHFPNDPRLFSSVEELRKLAIGPDALHWLAPDSEIQFGDTTIIVLYTSEGSGAVREFAFAYGCERAMRPAVHMAYPRQCTLIGSAYKEPDHPTRLRHEFDERCGELVFWAGDTILGSTFVKPITPQRIVPDYLR
jgi:hypothetical protein